MYKLEQSDSIDSKNHLRSWNRSSVYPSKDLSQSSAVARALGSPASHEIESISTNYKLKEHSCYAIMVGSLHFILLKKNHENVSLSSLSLCLLRVLWMLWACTFGFQYLNSLVFKLCLFFFYLFLLLQSAHGHDKGKHLGPIHLAFQREF